MGYTINVWTFINQVSKHRGTQGGISYLLSFKEAGILI